MRYGASGPARSCAPPDRTCRTSCGGPTSRIAPYGRHERITPAQRHMLVAAPGGIDNGGLSPDVLFEVDGPAGLVDHVARLPLVVALDRDPEVADRRLKAGGGGVVEHPVVGGRAVAVAIQRVRPAGQQVVLDQDVGVATGIADDRRGAELALLAGALVAVAEDRVVHDRDIPRPVDDLPMLEMP